MCFSVYIAPKGPFCEPPCMNHVCNIIVSTLVCVGNAVYRDTIKAHLFSVLRYVFFTLLHVVVNFSAFINLLAPEFYI